MTSEQIGGIVRTFLAFVAGFFASKGWIDQETALEIAAAVAGLFIIVWSWWQKRMAAKALAVAVLTPTSAEANIEARKMLTPQEAIRAAAVNLPPAKVTATGKVV